jgi:hypothetical protein
MHEIISRADAKRRGLKRYLTGQPCPHGHVAERRVSDFACVECAAGREAARPRRHRKRDREYMRRWREAHPDNLRAYAEKARGRPRTDAIRERQARYYAEQRDACRALQAKNRAERRARRLAAEMST